MRARKCSDPTCSVCGNPFEGEPAPRFSRGQRLAIRALAFADRHGGDTLQLRAILWRIFGPRHGDLVCQEMWLAALDHNGFYVRP